MRSSVVFFIVFLFCAAGVVSPIWGLLGYIWFAVLRPDILAWMDPVYPLSLMLAMCTGIGTLRFSERLVRLVQNPAARWLILLLIPVTVSYYGAVNPALAQVRYVQFMQMTAVLLLIPILIDTLDHIVRVILTIGLSLGILGVKFGAYGVAHGGVMMVGGYGGMLADNNFVALGLAMGVPLMWYGAQLAQWPALKTAFFWMTLASICGILMTNSRGGSIALGVALLMITWRSKHKAMIALLLLVAAAGAIYMVRDQYMARMSTLADPTQEASAASRVVLAVGAIKIWQQHPIIGVGFGGENFAYLQALASGDAMPHVVHNSYLEMLVDSGIFAFLIYVGMLFTSILWLGKAAKRLRSISPAHAPAAIALQTSLVVFAIGSNFYSFQRYDVTYMLILLTGCLYVCMRRMASPARAAAVVAPRPALAMRLARQANGVR